MPYSIVKFIDGYRVVSDKGHILSIKPLTKNQAIKQKIAVSLKEQLFKRKKL
jgi:hypothetical protein